MKNRFIPLLLLLSVSAPLHPFAETITSKDQQTLEASSQKIVLSLKQGDLAALAALVHPTKGARFSPSASVTVESDRVFKPDQVAKFSKDSKKYT